MFVSSTPSANNKRIAKNTFVPAMCVENSPAAGTDSENNLSKTDFRASAQAAGGRVPKVSVIVPVYKVEKYLPECIESVLAQTFTDFELILVDDGSPDNSGKICDAYAARDSRIRVFHKENGGVSSARNFGVKNARADYIAFLDSDDWWKPEFLEKMTSLTRKYPQTCCCCCCWITFSQQTGSKESGLLPGLSRGETAIVDLLARYAEKGIFPIWTGAVLLKKNIFNEIGGFDENLVASEDHAVWFEFVLRGNVAYLNDSLAFYRKDVPAENKPRWSNGRRVSDLKKHWVSHLGAYRELEKANPTVKLFLDRYRMFCLLNYRNDPLCRDAFLRVYGEISRSNFSWQYRIAYGVPVSLQKMLMSCYQAVSRLRSCIFSKH